MLLVGYLYGIKSERRLEEEISSNNVIERLNKEIRRRTRVIGIFSNPESYVCLVRIYLIGYSEDWSISRSYLSRQSISEIPQLAV